MSTLCPSKTGVEVLRVLEPIFAANKFKYLQTDNGKEYYNNTVQTLLKRYGIKHYSTFSEKKASIVERLNRTFKTLMYRAFSEQGHYRWLSLLPELIKKYNDTVHRTIGMKPPDVNERTVLKLDKVIKTRKNKLKVGDRVRISKYKMTFAKGYTPNWTNKIFTVHSIQPTVAVTYLFTDHTGKTLAGGFYEQELSKTSVGDVYLVQKLLQRKGDRVRMRWLGFNGKHDSWIPEKDLL